MLIGFVVIVANQLLTWRTYIRRHVPAAAGRWSVYPGQIAVSILCVAVSRIGHFVPGVIMGMSGDYEPGTQLELSRAGHRVLRSVLSLAGISLTAWVVSIPVAHAAARPDASSVILTLDSALAVLSVAGIETLVFGLIPLYFLEGDTLRRWSFRTWISIWSVGIVWFALVVVDPALNREAKEARASVAWLVILLVVEATISVGLWSYFAIRKLVRERERERERGAGDEVERGAGGEVELRAAVADEQSPHRVPAQQGAGGEDRHLEQAGLSDQ